MKRVLVHHMYLAQKVVAIAANTCCHTGACLPFLPDHNYVRASWLGYEIEEEMDFEEWVADGCVMF